jgi:hypothetical protein
MNETMNTTGKLGKCVSMEEREVVYPEPLGTAKEKVVRFEWEQPPSPNFLMTYNQFMEPNSAFVEQADNEGMTFVLRWGLMSQPEDKVRDLLNNWLARCESGTYRRSGISGRHL